MSETICWLTTNAELQRPGTLFSIQQSDLSSAGQLRPLNYHPAATTTTYHSNNSRSPLLASTSVAFGVMDESRKSLCTRRGRVSTIKTYYPFASGMCGHYKAFHSAQSVALVQLLVKLLGQHVYLCQSGRSIPQLFKSYTRLAAGYLTFQSNPLINEFVL